ncbi:hypothetical protein FOQG_03039 [Fusarium oxysporum f. sp. raphani 54005]|uniref:Uncharacterized protein n=3 Tax=Fusarium oxysporum TaxID=5507 RepID=X0DN31_FUSOX|nr:hypothetical protein FOVG_00694 [Fusarium oxysporum f. sp. pisi HDV247]EXK95732.1 hypothetical protein FOQG_03039 [Fusarium oxysporum f. sp. raphani 54005]EXL86769.1 hypothetical protein FOPG_01745 [Fusarium oxysporum f. sp. conglutinans race 2 54008]
MSDSHMYGQVDLNVDWYAQPDVSTQDIVVLMQEGLLLQDFELKIVQ